MPKCPYCKEELQIKLDINPGPIDDKFKSELLKTYENILTLWHIA